jgi:hypothetical protein
MTEIERRTVILLEIMTNDAVRELEVGDLEIAHRNLRSDIIAISLPGQLQQSLTLNHLAEGHSTEFNESIRDALELSVEGFMNLRLCLSHLNLLLDWLVDFPVNELPAVG